MSVRECAPQTVPSDEPACVGGKRSRVWKVRVVKAYHEAHNHLLVGEVVSKDRVCIEMHCRSFHFGRSVNSPKDIRAGELETRVIPWSQVEIINVLPAAFDSASATLESDHRGNISLVDGSYACPLLTSREPRL